MRRRATLLALPAALLIWAAATNAQAPGPVLVVGDSLGVGTGPHLKRELGGEVTVEARSGRPSPEGLAVLRERIQPSHRVVVFDLGTNDDPSQPARLRGTLAAAKQVAGKRCLVVSTLVRPPLDGVRVDGMNDVIEKFASANDTVRLADWRAAVRGSPELIARDRVHATPQGYAARARVVAEAVRSCSDEAGSVEPAQDDSTPQPESEPDPAPAPVASVPRRSPLAAIADRLPLELPLGLLREATGLVEGALRQAEGSVVPIAPDAVLGQERDPLGRRSP